MRVTTIYKQKANYFSQSSGFIQILTYMDLLTLFSID